MIALLIFALGCNPPTESRDRTDPSPGADTGPTGHDTDVGTDSETGTDTAPSTTATLDCSVLPPIPAPVVVHSGWPTGLDFDIDADGYYVTVHESDLYGMDWTGATKMLREDVAVLATGTRVLPTGDWVVTDISEGELLRVDAVTGEVVTLASGLDGASGIEVGEDGYVFVSASSDKRLVQIDPYTGETWLVVEELWGPRSIALAPDEQTLYATAFGRLYSVPRTGPTSWGDLAEMELDDVQLYGITTDACGNVYLIDNPTYDLPSAVRRIARGTDQIEMVAILPEPDLPSPSMYNLRWGHGLGGWDAETLYVSTVSGEVIAVDIGAPGKKHVLAP